MKKSSTSMMIASAGIMAAFVYAMTSISVPMPKPLGVWHIGGIASFIVAIFYGPFVGAFACGVGAMIFDIWNPLWGSSYITYAPATLVIRGLMGFLLGKLRRTIPAKSRTSELIAMVIASVEKNISYFIYDYALLGPVAYMDLITFFPLSALDIAITIPLLISLRKALKIEYVI
jgi:uncharacterized membrane protein